MKALGRFFNKIEEALNNVFTVFSKGFFFYLSLMAGLLHKIFPLSIFENLRLYFKRKQEDASAFLFLIIIFLIGVNVYIRFYTGNTPITHVSPNIINTDVSGTEVSVLDEKELNLYNRYSKLSLNSVSLKTLRENNDQVVSWLAVDGTSINYPIVKSDDNEFYLNHDFNKDLKSSGWTFMDYRNSDDLSDDNTVFYGHNLANKTAFGSLTNVFKKNWIKKSNHYIVVLNDDGKHIYEIFSTYEIEPEAYYIQTNFSNKEDLDIFFNALKARSTYDFKVDVGKTDRIITLSTCTDDNAKRRVVHAKLIKE